MDHGEDANWGALAILGPPGYKSLESSGIVPVDVGFQLVC